MAKVSKRGGFSDRNGIKSENTEIQLKKFDKRTRVQLWNMVSYIYGKVYGNQTYYMNNHIQEFLRYVLGEIYSEPVDVREIYGDDGVFERINETIIDSEVDDILTLVEALIQYWDIYLKNDLNRKYYNRFTNSYYKESLFEVANLYFKREYIGYRFVKNIIVPISDSYEVDTINETLNCKYQPVHEHISKANSLLADRNKPDYENSIKESITAVEAMSKL